MGTLLADGGFDFAEFDAEAAEFDLGVDAAEKFNVARVVVADEVAGAVDAVVGRGGGRRGWV